MRRFPILAMSIALVFFASGCLNADGDKPQAQPPANQPAETAPPAGGNATYDAAAAESLYKSNCSACHGQTLEGAMGPNLQHVGGKYSKEQIQDILNNGKGQMPGGLVKGGDAETLAAWLADKK
jgi:cytochrome c551